MFSIQLPIAFIVAKLLSGAFFSDHAAIVTILGYARPSRTVQHNSTKGNRHALYYFVKKGKCFFDFDF